MNHQPNPRRRHLVCAMPVLALACGAWPLPAMTVALEPGTHANLLRLVAQPDAALVGAAVLAQLAHQTPTALVCALASRLSGFFSGDLAQACALAVLQQAFQQAVRADFAQGRCVVVSGWVLAQSELELCALAALSQGATDVSRG